MDRKVPDYDFQFDVDEEMQAWIKKNYAQTFRRQEKELESQGQLLGDYYLINLQVGNTFKELEKGQYKVTKDGRPLKYKWRLFVRLEGDPDHKYIAQIIDRVNFEFWTSSNNTRRYIKNAGFFFDHTFESEIKGSQSAPIQIYWNRNVCPEKLLNIDFSINFQRPRVQTHQILLSKSKLKGYTSLLRK